jgi:hypothetical protein
MPPRMGVRLTERGAACLLSWSILFVWNVCPTVCVLFLLPPGSAAQGLEGRLRQQTLHRGWTLG